MTISIETKKEFREAILEEYGRDISLQDASTILTDLVGYFDTLAKMKYNIEKEDENIIK